MEVRYVESELPTVSKRLLEEFDQINVWVFDAEMGAGKTTLIKSICAELGVQDDMSSPTFSIINEYLDESAKRIYHFDFYRIEEVEELANIGVEEYLYSGNRCFLEWPEIAYPLLPDDYAEISIKLVDDNTRHLTAKFNGPTFPKRIR